MSLSRWRLIAAAALVAICGAACRQLFAPERGARSSVTAGRALARGAVLYEGYCAGCHGPDGQSGGPVADVLNLRPTDLGAPGVLESSDEEIVERVLHGTPLRTSPRLDSIVETHAIDALDEYVRSLSGRDAETIRAGRVVYETGCIACHGVYGEGMGVIMTPHAPPNLQDAQRRYTDAALASVIRRGVGEMPPMEEMLEYGEMGPLIAFLRVLSPGYRLYGTYCTGCHGDDGRGVHAEDLLAPGTPAPPIESRRLSKLRDHERRARILHMFRREQGLMPHFSGVLGADDLRDILAYLRAIGTR